MECILNSYAKLNLCLHIIGRSKKNYHFIQSVMNFIDLSDTIHITKSNKLEVQFHFNDKILFPRIDEDNNSIVKIIHEFCKKFNLNEEFSIYIEKNIPSGAGLGGGSANAATILKFLIKYYDLEISDEDKIKLALRIGCDTVACLYNKPIFVEGIGDIITKCNFDKCILNSYILIIYPQIFSNSILIYESFREKNYEFSDEIKFDKNTVIDINFLKKCKNDLTEVACQSSSEIEELLNFLNQMCDSKNTLLRMSGSGSTCFVLSEDKDYLKEIDCTLKTKYSKYFTRICKFT